jgi:hypothetical protein
MHNTCTSALISIPNHCRPFFFSQNKWITSILTVWLSENTDTQLICAIGYRNADQVNGRLLVRDFLTPMLGDLS